MATRRRSRSSKQADAEPILERLFDAPPERLFAYWTTREGIEAWWGRRGYRAKVQELDLRPGGLLRYRLEAADAEWSVNLDRAGMEPFIDVSGRFLEIEAPVRVVYAIAAQNAYGGPFVEVVSRVTLRAEGGGTRVGLEIEDVGNGPANHQTVVLRREELERLVGIGVKGW